MKGQRMYSMPVLSEWSWKAMDGCPFSLFSCLVALCTLWRSRQRRKKPPESIRLNLE
jgi:hypothetical protein